MIDRSPFRERFLGKKPLFGAFLKTPSTHAAEILGPVGFDFVVIDEEHAPFNRETTDRILLACRAVGIAGVVRVQSAGAILSVLDCGAAGVLVPHVDSVECARAVVQACRYAKGARGFSNTTRAGQYGGLGYGEHVAEADRTVTVIAMIEDPHAVDLAADILAVEGIDGAFIGRGDLTVAYQAQGRGADAVVAATGAIAGAARAAGKPVCALAASATDAATLSALGVSAFILSSDQGLMRQAAIQTLSTISDAVRHPTPQPSASMTPSQRILP